MRRIFAAAMPAIVAASALLATPAVPRSLGGSAFEARAEEGNRLLTFDLEGRPHCHEDGKDCNVDAQ